MWSLAGVASLIGGGLFLYDGAGGVRVSPVVLVAVAASVALFFGLFLSKLLAIRHAPALPHGMQAILGKEGVVIGSGLGPAGVVRVASEEWRAESSAGPLPRRRPHQGHGARRVGAHRRAIHGGARAGLRAGGGRTTFANYAPLIVAAVIVIVVISIFAQALRIVREYQRLVRVPPGRVHRRRRGPGSSC